MILIDSHCHLDLLIYKKIYRNIFEFVNFCKNKNIKYVISVSITIDNFFNILKLIDNIDNIFLTYGIHPLYYRCLNGYNLFKYKKFILNKKVVALGETGLDYVIKDICFRNVQKKNFENHLYLSEKFNKPIIIHSRFSFKDTCEIVSKFDVIKFGGVMHCYSYPDRNNLLKLLDLGLYISISGLITFSKYFFLKEIIEYLPLDRLFIESDAPYLSPSCYKNKINNPSNIVYVLNKISEIKGISMDNICKIIEDNFVKLFKLK